MIEAWVGLVGMAIVATATIIATQLQAHAERKERQKDREDRQRDRDEQYRWTLYPKRLEVHQQAYSWLRKLSAALNESDEVKIEVTNNADEWWYSNCLYLDGESREKVFDAILEVRVLLDLPPPHAEDKRSARLALQEAFRAVTNGIGMKHLEKASELNKN